MKPQNLKQCLLQKGFVISSLFIIVLLLAGCPGHGKPSDAEIEKATVPVLMGKGLNAVESIKNFVKTNGVQQDPNTYIAYVEFDVSFKKEAAMNDIHGRKIVTLIKSEKGWIVKNIE